MTREEAFRSINETQDDYVNQLVNYLSCPENQATKAVYFTSPTGTGKTMMMAKLINRLPDYYFIITTLSKGQLHIQTQNTLNTYCNRNNFNVYGSMDYKINSRLNANEIISRIPPYSKCIWLRDEGHIKTNKYEELLADKCYKVINFSATNIYSDIQCNFTHTMMLRTVNQQTGTPEDAIRKLMQIKEAHRNVKNYNPCAIFRCISGDETIYNLIVSLCEQNNLKHIDLSEDEFQMAELCKDDNEYDVIINKFKLIEGIDIRRAHVLYMDTQPQSDATSIQAIGRCRRNALLYRNDIDILSPDNEKLLKETRECYVFFNVKDMKINTDAEGELCYAFCPYISCEALKVGATIDVANGQLQNGLYVKELEGKTGTFTIVKDEQTGFNVVDPITDFYKKEIVNPVDYLYTDLSGNSLFHKLDDCKKIYIHNVIKMLPYFKAAQNNSLTIAINRKVYITDNKKLGTVAEDVIKEFEETYALLTDEVLKAIMHVVAISRYLENIELKVSKSYIREYIHNNHDICKCLCETGLDISAYMFKFDDGLEISINHILSEESIEFLLYSCIYFYKKYSSNGISSEEITRNLKNKIKRIARNICAFGIQKDDSPNAKKIMKQIFLNVEMPYRCISYDTEISIVTNMPCLTIRRGFGDNQQVTKEDIILYFNEVFKYLKTIEIFDIDDNFTKVCTAIRNRIQLTYTNLLDNIVEKYEVDFSSLYDDISEKEMEKIEQHEIPLTLSINTKRLREITQYYHHTTVNDRESAIIGLETFKPFKSKSTKKIEWIESSTITTKVNGFTKLNRFVTSKYEAELAAAKAFLFTGKNSFSLDRKCNSMLGYCVEYYSKYLIFGEPYLKDYVDKILNDAAKREDKQFTSLTKDSPLVIIRACMLKYKDMVAHCFGQNASHLIRIPSVETLIKKDFTAFFNLVIDLGIKTAEFVRATLYSDRSPLDNIDPNLSMRHIVGLADYITEDTILDVKVTNYIDESYIKQVLAYHYLSTKRDDVCIKRVIVYDATSGRSVSVQITPQNVTEDKRESLSNHITEIKKDNEIKLHEEMNKQKDPQNYINYIRMQYRYVQNQKKEQARIQALREKGRQDQEQNKTDLMKNVKRIMRLQTGKATSTDYRKLMRAYAAHPIITKYMDEQKYETLMQAFRWMTEYKIKDLGRQLWDAVKTDFSF